MPIKYKNKETKRKLKKNPHDTCKICGKPISFDVLGSIYCVMCKIKHSDQIRAKKRNVRKILNKNEVF